MNKLRSGLGCLLLLVLIVFCYEGVIVLKTINQTLLAAQATNTELQNSIKLTREHIDRDLTVAGVALSAIEKTAKETQKASAEQRFYWAKSSQEVTKTIDSVNKLVMDTDSSINSQITPSITTMLSEVTDTMKKTGNDVDSVALDLKPSLEALTTTISDPAIKSSFSHIDVTAAQLAISATNVAEGTALAVKYEKVALAPVSLIKRVVYGVAGIAGRLLGW